MQGRVRPASEVYDRIPSPPMSEDESDDDFPMINRPPLLDARELQPPPIELPTQGKWTDWTNVSPDDYRDHDGVMRLLGKSSAQSARLDAADGTIWYDRKFRRVFIIEGFEVEYDFGNREWGHPVPEILKMPSKQSPPLWLYASQNPGVGWKHKIWGSSEPEARGFTEATDPPGRGRRNLSDRQVATAVEASGWGPANSSGLDPSEPAWGSIDYSQCDQFTFNHRTLDDRALMQADRLQSRDSEPLPLDAASQPSSLQTGKGKGKARAPPDQDGDTDMVDEEIERCPDHLTLSERFGQLMAAQTAPFDRMALGVGAGSSSTPMYVIFISTHAIMSDMGSVQCSD